MTSCYDENELKDTIATSTDPLKPKNNLPLLFNNELIGKYLDRIIFKNVLYNIMQHKYNINIMFRFNYALCLGTVWTLFGQQEL